MTETIEPNSPADLTTIVEGIHHTLSMAVLQEPVGSRLLDGSFDLDTYIRLLKQTYHYVHRTAPWLARAAARTTDAGLCSLLAQKAQEETGHERWALADLAALGVDISEPERWPVCRAVAAYIAWHDFAIEEIRPEAVLGAAYILERLSEAHAGVRLGETLEDVGCPKHGLGADLLNRKVMPGDVCRHRATDRPALGLADVDAKGREIGEGPSFMSGLLLRLLREQAAETGVRRPGRGTGEPGRRPVHIMIGLLQQADVGVEVEGSVEQARAHRFLEHGHAKSMMDALDDSRQVGGRVRFDRFGHCILLGCTGDQGRVPASCISTRGSQMNAIAKRPNFRSKIGRPANVTRPQVT